MRAAVLLAALVAGCTTAHVEANAQFTPPLNGEFAYAAQAYAGMSESDEGAERLRLAALNKQITQGGFCPGGYAVTDRRVVRNSGLLDTSTIYYRGRCKS